MRNGFEFLRNVALAGLAGLALTALTPVTTAHAQGGPTKRNVADAPPSYNPDHQSTIRISERDSLPVHRGIKWKWKLVEHRHAHTVGDVPPYEGGDLAIDKAA